MIRNILTLLLALSLSAAVAQDNKKLQEAFTLSYTYEYNLDYKKAIDALKAEYGSGSYELNLRLGWLYYCSGDYAASVEYYQKSISQMPYAIEPRFGIAYPLSAQNKWDDVAKQYEEILKTDPNQITANYRLGLIHYNKGNFTKAKPYFDKYLNLYPFDYDANHMAAWTNLNLGKINEARVLFNKALLTRPADASALDGLSRCK